MTDQSILPIRFYGSNISYFSGKLEMYFRVRGIPYEWHTMTMRCMDKVIGPQYRCHPDAGTAVGRRSLDD